LTRPKSVRSPKARALASKAWPGLRSKAFAFDAEKREAINFYVWDSAEAAEAFFGPELIERVTGLYGVRPNIQFVSVAELVDNH